MRVRYYLAVGLWALVIASSTTFILGMPWSHPARLGQMGVLIYAGTGVAGLLLGHNYLDYSPLAQDPEQGQHYGILIVELGVGITVASVMIAIYYAFATRPPRISDWEW